ncbi:hypothetical protein V8G54_004333 [Vigna mungo]|uniref:Uncharacterized protein n=1 Tax=Vigna mungo TaxID=3915 RepID=A0AAQ3SFJ3_VIGMU
MRIWEKSKGLATWVDGLNTIRERLNAAHTEISGEEGEAIGKTSDQVQEVGSSNWERFEAWHRNGVADCATTGEEVLKIASPAISEASKKAQSFSSWKTSLEDDVLKVQMGMPVLCSTLLETMTLWWCRSGGRGREREDDCMGGEGVDLDFAEARSGEGCTP